MLNHPFVYVSVPKIHRSLAFNKKLFPDLYISNIILKSEEIKIYHGLSNEIPKNLNKNIKSIVTIHDLIYLKYPKFYNFIDRNIYYHKSKYACQNSNLIIAISNQTKNDII